MSQDDTRYQQLRQDYSETIGKIAEIESERKEHIIVIETLRKTSGDRRCWKMSGETLVEKDKSETLQTLQQQLDNINQILEVLFKKLKETEHQLKAFQSRQGSST